MAEPAFRWVSPLGLSCALFLSYAAFCLVLGIAGPAFLHSGHPSLRESLFFSRRIEPHVYGKPTRELVAEAPALLEVRRQVMDVWCSFALALAIVQVPVVWYGLRARAGWALWSLTASDLAIAAIYFLLVAPAAMRATRVGLFDLHPFAWYPALMTPLAAALGWWGLRSS